MRLGFLNLVIAFAGAAVWASPPEFTHKLKESVAPPRGWERHGSAPPDHIIKLRIGLPQPNFPELERHLYEVSDPDHERYGQHLSKEEVEALVAPHPESVELVSQWLAEHGFDEADLERSSAKDWVTIRVPVRVAEMMLDTVGDLPWQPKLD